jgi:hypothetical protein
VRDRRAALELLGLETGEPVTHDRLRRAYLRRLRAHPPERDPEGFQRLREAFEALEPLARVHDYMRAAAAARAQSGAAAGVDEPERSEAATDEDGDDESESAGAIVVLDHGECVEVRPAMPVGAVAWDWLTVRAEADARTGESSGESEAARAADGESPGADESPDEPPDESPYRRSGRPLDASIEDPPTTLCDVTDEILALLQAGKLDAALEVADRWRHSTLDDHREVSPNDAQRWALTRELLDVAPASPDPLRRAIARGIATGNLATAYSAAEMFQARHPAQANDLARHFAKRATSLHKVLGQPLQSLPALGETLERSTRSSRAPIWIAVLVISALVRAAGSCEEHPRRPNFDYTPRPQLPIEYTPRPPSQIDSRPLLPQLDDRAPRRFDPQHKSWLDRRLEAPTPDLHSLPSTGASGSEPLIEMRPEGQAPPRP